MARSDDVHAAPVKLRDVARLPKGERVAVRVLLTNLNERASAGTGDRPSLYLRANDETHSLRATFWPDQLEVAKAWLGGKLASGLAIQTRATVNIYKGERSLNLEWDPNPDASFVIEEADACLPRSDVDFERAHARLLGTIAALRAPLCAVVDAALPPWLAAELCRLHAAVGHHHAVLHGLLVHVLQMLDVVEGQLAAGDASDGDLVRAAVILHDVGKLWTYEVTTELAVRHEEGLVGHAILGAHAVAKATHRLRASGTSVAPAVEQELLHAILAHTGPFETPVQPVDFSTWVPLNLLPLARRDAARVTGTPAEAPVSDPALARVVTSVTGALGASADDRSALARATQGALLRRVEVQPRIRYPEVARALALLLPLADLAVPDDPAAPQLLLPEQLLAMHVAHALAAETPTDVPYGTELALLAALHALRVDALTRVFTPYLPATDEARLVAYADNASAQSEKEVHALRTHPDDAVALVGERERRLLSHDLAPKAMPSGETWR